jgi:agmatine/peptidylarginine deiminase
MINDMKRLLTLFYLALLIQPFLLQAQQQTPVLTHEMTPEEELRKHEIGRDFVPTEPPEGNVRSVGEFEEMQSVLVRYPFGIPMSLIVEMSQDCKVKTIVASTSEQQTVLNQYISAGVNTANCEWLIAPSNSYWTRDYGPWWVVDGNYDVGICDFPYNRPRPYDDNIPVVLAQQMGVPLWGMDLIHTGGNWMDDGLGIGASTTLVATENPDLTEEEIDTLVRDYMGIHKYMLIDDPLDDYIEHIDCWGKFLDVDKILIGQVPQSDYRYEDYEFVANYFALQTTSWGNKFQVYRVYTPGTYPYTPYTNSLILNKKVFVPITGSQWDDEALAVYEEAMPGYEIIGIMHTSWENTDALHCRAKGIADVGMLYVNHIPVLGEQDFRMQWELTADIIPYSGMGVIGDSLLCYYKVNEGDYQVIPLEHVAGYQYNATLPLIEPGTEVSYYLHAVDISGRRKNHPYIGAPDPHVFTVDYAETTLVDPDSLIYLSFDEMVTGKSFSIYNYTDGELIIDDIEDEGSGLFHWYIEGFDMTFPYIMTMNEVLDFNVMISMPVNHPAGYMVTDTLDILAEDGHYKIILKVDSDLLNGIAQPFEISAISRIESVSPNPFQNSTRIVINLEQNVNVFLAVYNLNGRIVSTIVNQDLAAGKFEFVWDGNDESGGNVPVGIYFLKLETERGADFKKLIFCN